MAYIRARQGAITRRFPHQGNKKYVIGNRPKLGPPVAADEGADHEVTLTGPSQEVSVTFPAEAGKTYRVFSTILNSSAAIRTPAYNEALEVAVTPGDFVNPTGTAKPSAEGSDPTLYGHAMVAVSAKSIGTSIKLYMVTSPNADPADSVTYGNFYIREVKAP